MSKNKSLFTYYFMPSNVNEGVVGDFFFKPPSLEGVGGRLI